MVDDRRHAQSNDGGEDILVNLSISNSNVDLYRQYVIISGKRASTFHQKNGSSYNFGHVSAQHQLWSITLATLKYDIWCKIEFCKKTTQMCINAIQKFIMESLIEKHPYTLVQTRRQRFRLVSLISPLLLLLEVDMS